MPAPHPRQRPERRTTAHPPPPPTEHDVNAPRPQPRHRATTGPRDVDDPEIDAALDAMVDAAPPLPYQVRARLAWLLHGHHHHARRDRAA